MTREVSRSADQVPGRPASLARRLLLITLAAVGLAWLCQLAWVYWETSRLGSSYIEQDLRFLAETFAGFHAASLDDPERARVTARMVEQFSYRYSDPPMSAGDFVYRITHRDGRLLAMSDAWPALQWVQPGAPAFDDGPWRTLAARSSDGQVEVQVALSRAYIRRVLAETLWFLILPLAVTLPVIVGLLALGIRRGLLPLSRLAKTLAARRPEDTHPVPQPEPHYRELQPVTAALDQLVGQLQALRDTERRFFADAAHELRTPLAVIGAQAHVLAAASTAAERQSALTELQAGVERGAKLLSQLLTLSRLDTLETRLTPEAVDLAAAAKDAISRHAPRAVHQRQELSFSGGEVSVCCDPAALSTLLDNLLDNALRYTPAGSTIAVTVGSCPQGGQLVIADNGPGIPPAWRERVLERFVRLPDSSAPGSGLGLAIVQRLVTLQGGSLQLGDGLDGRGLGIAIRLPAAGDAVAAEAGPPPR